MLLRNRVYAPYGVITVFEGLTDATIAGLPGAIARFLAAPAGRALRSSLGRPGRPQRLGAALAGSVVHLPAGVPLRELIARAQRRATERGALPIVLVTSGNAVALRVPHGAMDGRGAMEFYRFVVDTAAGGTGALDERPAPRLPYLRMLKKHLRGPAVRAYRTEQRDTVGGPLPRTPTASDLALETARFETFVLSADEVERLCALDRRGSSSSARLGSLAISTLRRVYLGSADLPVQIPVDLRRWAPAGRIDGNFISVAPLGSLLDTDWSATELGSRIREAIKARTPIVRSLHAMLWRLSRAPKHAAKRLLGRADGPGPLGVSVSMLIDPTDYVDEAWLPDVPRRVGAATVGPWPSSTFVSIVQSARRVRMTVWDESGEFDLERFRAALNEELDARLARASA